MVVYSFGPFDTDPTTYSTSKGHKIEARGIVRKYEGEAASAYNDGKRNNTDMQIKVVNDVSDEKVVKIVEDILSKGVKVDEKNVVDKSQGGAKVGTISEYNVNTSYGRYDVFNNNCTTFVCDILNNSGSKALMTETIVPTGAFLKSPIKSNRLARPIILNDLRIVINSNK